MKILHAIFGEGFFGSERYCIELATAQAARGHEVAIAVRGGETRCAEQFRALIAAAHLDGPTGPGTVRLIAIPAWLPAMLHRPAARAVLKKIRPDIVHTHLNPAARRVGRVAQRIGIPHLATLHIRYDAREFGRCDGLICGAAWQQKTIPTGFPGIVKTIRTWLPVEVHEALRRVGAKEVEALRRAWGADARTIVFGSIGRMVPEKGMDVLIAAFHDAFPGGEEAVKLIVIGEGPDKDELRRAAAGDPRIALVGAQDDIATCYPAFDVYVSAARFEPFGLTILEAMDAGCPLIVTRTDGPREFLKDDRTRWAETNDAATLSRQLSAAAARGRERLSYDLTPFRRDTATEAIEDFYREVMARQRGGRNLE
jgi:glycosyltransferase involved in cell wall biosynthesis